MLPSIKAADPLGGRWGRVFQKERAILPSQVETAQMSNWQIDKQKVDIHTMKYYPSVNRNKVLIMQQCG